MAGYDYHDDDVYAFIGRRAINRDRLIVSYSRVSTAAQRNQLKEQTARIYDSRISRGLSLDMQLEDIKSGMASDRQGFQNREQR